MKTIDIKTSQNVVIEYELAALRDRLLGAFLDVLIVFGAYFILLLLIIRATGANFSEGFVAYVVFGLLPLAVFVLYQFLFELLGNGQSIGKRVMHTRVVKTDGSELEIGDFLVRAVFYLIDGFLSAGVVGSLAILSSGKHQRFGDYAANTTIVRLRSSLAFELEDILSIDSIDDYEPTYPQVRELSEEDMLVIKNTITRYKNHRNEAHREAILQLTKRLEKVLDIPNSPNPKLDFLKTLIRDYIVLTR
ncbi:MAG: RDD family protein [Bacteroidota bacterium]